ncbi:uncharacterized protein LOC104855786 isoform X4 [Fukomys damarensis]|nr:uncharacterized protein LOC104855786 isoform X4 [Fukomys damarensis]
MFHLMKDAVTYMFVRGREEGPQGQVNHAVLRLVKLPTMQSSAFICKDSKANSTKTLVREKIYLESTQKYTEPSPVGLQGGITCTGHSGPGVLKDTRLQAGRVKDSGQERTCSCVASHQNTPGYFTMVPSQNLKEPAGPRLLCAHQ